MPVHVWRRIAAATTLPLLFSFAALAQTPPAPVPDPALPATYGNLLTPVLTGNTTITGETIAYPADGVPEITNAIVTIPPGGETGWHSHSVPLYVYILSGTVTVDYGSKGTRTMSAGSAFLEALNWPHNAHNYGKEPVEILAVYLGVEGVANADSEGGPE